MGVVFTFCRIVFLTKGDGISQTVLCRSALGEALAALMIHAMLCSRGRTPPDLASLSAVLVNVYDSRSLDAYMSCQRPPLHLRALKRLQQHRGWPVEARDYVASAPIYA